MQRRRRQRCPKTGAKPRMARSLTIIVPGRAAPRTARLQMNKLTHCEDAALASRRAIAAPWLGRLAWDLFCLAALIETSKTHFSVSRDSTENERFRAHSRKRQSTPSSYQHDDKLAHTFCSGCSTRSALCRRSAAGLLLLLPFIFFGEYIFTAR